VILIGVMLDQTVHLVQAKRRIRAAGAAAEAQKPALASATSGAAGSSDAAAPPRA
jgi:hypothetical protein